MVREESGDGEEVMAFAFDVLRGQVFTEVVTKEGAVLQIATPLAFRLEALRIILERGWGKPSASLDNDSEPSTVELKADPASLLSLAVRTLARALAETDARTAQGYVPTSEALAATSQAARTLSTLARMELELAKGGPGANLSDEALADAVLKAVPTEKLRATLAQREATIP